MEEATDERELPVDSVAAALPDSAPRVLAEAVAPGAPDRAAPVDAAEPASPLATAEDPPDFEPFFFAPLAAAFLPAASLRLIN